MSFRQYGGINYAARNNIVKNNYSNANNLSVMTKVGQPSSIINFESDVSANIIYSNLTVDNLTVKNSSTHKESLDVSGDATITGNLDVSGNSTITGNLDVSGNSTITGNLDVSGNTTLKGPLDVTTDALINGLIIGRGGGNEYRNTAVGVDALSKNDVGYNNTAIGYKALCNNEGYYSYIEGVVPEEIYGGGANTAIGYKALFNITGNSDSDPNMRGNHNVAVGTGALFKTKASGNIGIGINTLYYNDTGFNNIAIGTEAGTNYFDGDGGPTNCNNCTFIGTYSGGNTFGPYYNSTAIGYYSQISANDQIVLGGSTDSINYPNVYIPGTLTVDGDLRGKKKIYIGKDNPNLGTNDTAYLEYVAYTDSGTEKTVLRIVVENDNFTTNPNLTDNINLNPSGNVGINTDDPQYKLDVQGTLRATGDCTAGSFNAASDYRIKENVLNLAGDSKFTVDNLRPVTYKNILSGKQDMGFIAHELQEQYPFLVTGEKDGVEKQSVNYIGLIALLVKEIQELKQDIKILKTNL